MLLMQKPTLFLHFFYTVLVELPASHLLHSWWACRCMLNTADGPTDAVEDYLCDPEEMPLGTRESRLPCPEDCVLSDWSPWTLCDLVREPLIHLSAIYTWYLHPSRASKPRRIVLHIDCIRCLFLIRSHRRLSLIQCDDEASEDGMLGFLLPSQ